MDTLLEDIQKMSKELQYLNVVIEAYIPGPYQSLIEDNCTWNDDVGDWSLNCVAYAGNNIQHYLEDDETEKKKNVAVRRFASCSS